MNAQKTATAKRHVTAQVNFWGNSLAIRIPKPVAKSVGLRGGENVDLSFTEGEGLFSVEKIPESETPKFDIRSLMAQVTPENRPEEISWGEPQGREVW